MNPTTELIVRLPKPHPTQLKVLKEAKRFNVLCNGRRWGKTTLSLRLIKPAITDAWKIGFWTPTYKDLSEVWVELKSRLQPIIKRKDEQLKKIELITGGLIDMWSMDDPDSGRGFAYHRAIIDEFAKARNGQYAWEKTIRATLTDFKGDGWFLSTPKGINSYFFELFEAEKRLDDWKSWQLPTKDNPYIDPKEVDEAEKMLDPLTFRQEYLAQFISTANRPFMYCFEDRHISEKAIYIPGRQIYLSFDFNVAPMTCVISQTGMNGPRPYIHFIGEIFLPNSDITEVCRRIKTMFPSVAPTTFMITGDRSGNNRSGLDQHNNYYTLIKRELNVQEAQIKTPPNPHHADNIVLCNSILAKYPEIFFHPTNCKETIYDMRFTEWDGQKIIKENRNKRAQQGDCLDGVRYTFNTWHYNFLKLSK